MSTSAGPMQGYSKAIGVAFCLMVCKIPYSLNVNFGGAWTSLNLMDIAPERIPIFMSLVDGLNEKFWV